MGRYRELEVTGDPHSMGRQIGEALGEEIRAFHAIARSLIRKTIRISDAAIDRVVQQSVACAELYAPWQVDELRGMAAGAKLTLADIMLLQVRNQMQPDREAGCTSFAIAAGGEHGGLVAQNWDNDPSLDPFTVVLTRRPVGQPAFLTVTQAGLISYIGFNERGLGLCLNTLPAPARTTGVPHYFTVRSIFAASSLDEAVGEVRRAERAIPANIMMITPEGPADLEVTIDDVHVLRDQGLGRVTHTNHCQHPELCGINEKFPELIQSHDRQRRIDELLDSCGRTVDVSQVQAILRDHDAHPRSICRHANNDPQTGFWETVFSVVMEPTAGRMYLTRGTPCCCDYELYELK